MQRRLLTALGVVAAVGLVAGNSTADEKEQTGLDIGKPVPSFRLTDEHGEEVSLRDYKGQIVVLEWTNPQCPVVKGHYAKKTMVGLQEKYGEKVAWIAINSSHFATDEENKGWVDGNELQYPVLNDASGHVGNLYDARTTPHMFVVAADGKLAYQGAIDNNPRGDAKEPVNYVEAALRSLLADEAVEVAETKPYGCSVKYKPVEKGV